MTTNDTRTARERAEELAASTAQYNSTEGPRIHPRIVSALERTAFVDGFLARDAEPTTVSAEKIEKAAIGLISIGLPDMPKDRAEAVVRVIFRAAEFRIEGDPA